MKSSQHRNSLYTLPDIIGFWHLCNSLFFRKQCKIGSIWVLRCFQQYFSYITWHFPYSWSLGKQTSTRLGNEPRPRAFHDDGHNQGSNPGSNSVIKGVIAESKQFSFTLSVSQAYFHFPEGSIHSLYVFKEDTEDSKLHNTPNKFLLCFHVNRPV